MALKLLRVLVLGVIAAAADDVQIKWSSTSRASLPCVVAGADRIQARRPPPPLDVEDRPRPRPYLWRRGEDEINPKRVSPTGVLEVSKRRDGSGEGVYQCAVRHQGGLVLGYPVHLKFASMEKQFTSHPENVTTRSGQPVLLTCEISSAPPASYSWLKDDQDLPDSTRYHLLSNQLLITDVKDEDSGFYKCVATNSLVNKTKTSDAGRLEVENGDEDLDVAFLPVQYEHEVLAPRWTKVVLPCPVAGWPRPKLVWKLTPPGGGRTSELEVEDEVLVLTSLEFDQEGVYTCSVQGHQQLTKRFNVTITERPLIVIPPSGREALRASTVRFNCTAAGAPAPDITWYKDGQMLGMGGRTNIRTSADGKRLELVVSGVISDDAGVYQCFAQNAAGTASSWASLNVTGADAAAPAHVRCWPTGARSVYVTWSKPATGQVVAYTVHNTPIDDKPGSAVPGQPLQGTEARVTLDKALTPYRFQVKAYVKPSAPSKNSASDLSAGEICHGQGVPIRLVKIAEDSVLVSWRQFSEQTRHVAQWILQYRDENSTEEHNVTLDGPVYNYTLTVSPNKPLQVRLLGSKSYTWLHQNLTMVPWTSTTTAGLDDFGDITAIPQDLEVVKLTPRSLTVSWRLDDEDMDRYIYRVCVKKVDGVDKCIESNKNWATFDGLQPGSEYEVKVQACIPGRALGGAFSLPFVLNTPSEGPERFREFSGQYINSTTLRLSWNGKPARYTVHYSSQLKLPVELWSSVETTDNTVLINTGDPSKNTYVMVTGYEPKEHSKIETIPPRVEEKDLDYEYTSSGLRVSWLNQGPHVVCYTQNLTRPLEDWSCAHVTESTIELTGIDANQNTYIMVTSGKNRHNQVLTIKPRPKDNSSMYLGIGIGCGVLVLCAVAVAAVCLWRRRKRARSPVRARRRNVPGVEGTEEEGSELKNIGGRLANGGGSKDGEPLLNGHVHITENPTSKTPNGKMKKGVRYEAAFDVSRYEDPDATVETVLDADTSASTTFNLLDTSRRPEFDTRSSSANNSFNKLPDDNMNSELTRSTDFELDNSKIQPTLQPNG